MTRRRLLYAADLHGSDRCFRKILNSAKFYGAQDLLIGGDLTGKVVVPFIETPNGTFSSKWLGKEGMTAREVEEAEGHLTNAGLYPCRVSPAEMAELEAKPERVYELFNQLMRERLVVWLRLADERLKPLGVRLYVIPGNDDRLEMDSVMKQAEQVVYCESEVIDLSGHELVSCGWTNITPWHTTRELPEEALEQKLEALAAQITRPQRAIVNFHCPPTETKLDLAPLLTKDFKYVGKGGAIQVQHVGSSAVRHVIERHQPLLGLHGHIHESRGEEMIGRTLCLNPGSEYGEGILDAVIVQLDDEKVAGHQFTTG
jgi:uncharacterized protein